MPPVFLEKFKSQYVVPFVVSTGKSVVQWAEILDSAILPLFEQWLGEQQQLEVDSVKEWLDAIPKNVQPEALLHARLAHLASKVIINPSNQDISPV